MFVWLKPTIRGQLYSYIILFFTMIPNSSSANCSCQKANPYLTFIGTEYMATSCPSETPSDDDYYVYISNAIECPDTTISQFAAWGDTPNLTPAQLSSFIVSNGYRVVRNASGSHILNVHTNFQGTVAGVNMAGKPPGVYYTDPLEDFDFCTWSGPNCDNCPNDPLKTDPGICGCGVEDTDGDGDGDIDCIFKDNNQGPSSCEITPN